MTAEIFPSTLRGSVTAPPSKSCAHRALICAALSKERSVIDNISLSGDVMTTLGCIRTLGRPCEVQGSRVIFPEYTVRLYPSGELDCGESGSALRFMVPVLLLCGGGRLTGSPRLMERGVAVYEQCLGGSGIRIVPDGMGITVEGELQAGEYILPGNVSSQYISGLLMTLPLLPGDSALHILPPIESGSYIALTGQMTERFGVSTRRAGEYEYHIPGNQCFRGGSVTLEGDWSNAAFLIAAKRMGGELDIRGLDNDSIQPDRAGAALFGLPEADISACPDMGPVLMAYAAFTGRETHITGTARLRLKESDRAAAMVAELRKFGIELRVGENEITVCPGTLREPCEPLDCHNDHRVAMALSLLCLRTGGVLRGAECVGKSWPEYFDVLMGLGADIELR